MPYLKVPGTCNSIRFSEDWEVYEQRGIIWVSWEHIILSPSVAGGTSEEQSPSPTIAGQLTVRLNFLFSRFDCVHSICKQVKTQDIIKKVSLLKLNTNTNTNEHPNP